MSVYVDGASNQFGCMIMCHMIADTTPELLAMAHKIGVREKWIQSKGTYREHFDICKSKRKLAIKNGARELTSMELVKITMAKYNSVTQFL